jgi:hypothetical protein
MLSKIFILFMLIGVPILALYTHMKHTTCSTTTITKIYMCTEDANNAWDGHKPGTCRVETTSGRETVKKPIAVGDTVTVCKYDPRREK